MTLKSYLQLVEVHLFETYGICAVMMFAASLMFKNEGYGIVPCVLISIVVGLFGVFFANPIGTIMDPYSGRLRLRKSMFDNCGESP